MTFKVPIISKFEWQRAVKSILSSPPDITLKGDRYIVGKNPSNAWVDQTDKIAEYINNEWEYTFPFPGMMVFINLLNKLYKYTENWNDLVINNVIEESTGRQLIIEDLNTTINYNSLDNQTFILPNITAQCIGGWFRFIKTGTGSITVQAGASDRIADSGIGDTVYCDIAAQDFATLKILCVSIGQWVITGGHGTWTTTEHE
jgi:hypothetical protein